MGIIVHLSLKEQNGKWENGLKIQDSKKIGLQGWSAPTWGNIHVYDHNIQRSSYKVKSLQEIFSGTAESVGMNRIE